MKTFYLILSKVFPSTHSRAGQPTNFRMAFDHAWMCARCREYPKGMCMNECVVGYSKLHTIRSDYGYWAKCFEEIAAGKARLSIRQWSGKPYRSKQTELCVLTKDDGIGLQRLSFDVDDEGHLVAVIDGSTPVSLERLANNDGLSLDDWKDWFYGYPGCHNLAIIHFTKFRY